MEAAAFEEQIVPLLGGAYRTALRLTRNAADAEDLVQDAVLRAFRGVGGFEVGSNFRAWFYRILTNAFFSGHRQAQRRPATVPLDDTPELFLYGQTAAIGLHDRSDDPAADLLDRLEYEQVAEAIDLLPTEYRVVAVLYFGNDLKYDDIAQALQLPIGTVRSRLHRARRLLQRALWQVAQDRGIVAELGPKEH